VTRIETATVCACGLRVVLEELPTFALPMRWQASCRRCLDPVEDASAREKVVGHGRTPDEALWYWQESHDESWEVEWRPVTTLAELEEQVLAELDRQCGWKVTDRWTHKWWGPQNERVAT